MKGLSPFQTALLAVFGLGIVGTGNRGTSLLGMALRVPSVEIRAICDIDQSNLERAESRVVKAGIRAGRVASNARSCAPGRRHWAR